MCFVGCLYLCLVLIVLLLLLLSGDVELNPGPSVPVSVKMKNLKIIHLNTRSLLCHFDEIQSLVLSHHPDIFAVTESWLNPSVSDTEVCFPGFRLFRCDRSRSGGGIAVYVADHLSCCSLPHPTGTPSDDVEYLWLSISSFGSSSTCFVLGCIYRPPSLPSSSVESMCLNIESMLVSHKHVVVCGDWNIDFSDKNHSLTKKLQNFITSHSLSCPISDPTQISASRCSIIAYFLCTSDISISKSTVLDCSVSDHLPILLSIDWSTPTPPHRTITRRSFKHFSSSAFNADLVSVPWFLMNLFDDVDDKVFVFTSLFTDTLSYHAPIKTVRVKKNRAPWISKSIRDEMDKRNKLQKRFLSTRATSDWDEYKLQRNSVVALQRKAKIEYFRNLISKNASTTSLWNTLRSALPLSTSSHNWNSLRSDINSFANSLNDHFVNICSVPQIHLFPPPPAPILHHHACTCPL